MTISKKSVIHVIILIWIVFSLAYICWDIWSDFEVNQLSQAYQQGRIDTVNALIEQAQGCNPISVSSTSTQIQVINVNCMESSE